MSSGDVRILQALEEDRRIVAVRSWAATIEEIATAVAETPRKRFKSHIEKLDSRIQELYNTLGSNSLAEGFEALGTSRAAEITSEDPRLTALSSWIALSSDLQPFITQTSQQECKEGILSFDVALRQFHSSALKLPSIPLQVSPSSLSPHTLALISNLEESPSLAEISPTALAVARKKLAKGELRDPKLWTFESQSDMDERHDNTLPLKRGLIFKNYFFSPESTRCPQEGLSEIDMPEYKGNNQITKNLVMQGDSKLSFADELVNKKPEKKSSLYDPQAKVVFIRAQEDIKIRLSEGDQPEYFKLPAAAVLVTSAFLEELLLAKHSRVLSDIEDIIIYDPETTCHPKQYMKRIAIYADGLYYSDEVRERAENSPWMYMSFDAFWCGLQIYGEWGRTGEISLEDYQDIDEVARAAKEAATYLQIGQHEFWEALENARREATMNRMSLWS